MKLKFRYYVFNQLNVVIRLFKFSVLKSINKHELEHSCINCSFWFYVVVIFSYLFYSYKHWKTLWLLFNFKVFYFYTNLPTYKHRKTKRNYRAMRTTWKWKELKFYPEEAVVMNPFSSMYILLTPFVSFIRFCLLKVVCVFYSSKSLNHQFFCSLLYKFTTTKIIWNF